METAAQALRKLQERVVVCARCPRLVAWRTRVAREKKAEYRDWEYWGRPIPSIGDPEARLLVLGLAPAAHGGNRTGRMFTGDRSGDFLMRAMYQAGFASQPCSRSRDDGLTLTGAYITAVLRCAPPLNKPTPEEIRNCREYLEREVDLLQHVRVVVALGRLAFDQYLGLLRRRGLVESRAAFLFAHNREHDLGPQLPLLISSYHPSRQNTSTGRLTEAMLGAVFARARSRLLSEPRPPGSGAA